MSEQEIRNVLRFPGPDDAAEGEAPSPIVPLGHNDGRFFIIDATGQIRSFGYRDLSYHALGDLCAMPENQGWPPGAWLARIAPELGKDGKPTGDYNAKRAGSVLMSLCRRQGMFDPEIDRRTAGVWLGQAGELAGALLVHWGEHIEVWRDGALIEDDRPPGFVDGETVYVPSPARLHQFAEAPIGAREAVELVQHLRCWGWRDPVMPEIFAGLLCLCFYGQAAPWRVHAAISAPPKTGKTELALFSTTALAGIGWYRNEFTEAFIRQALTGQARALVLDENENESHGGESAASRAIKLIRRLSGEEGYRGGRGSAGGRATAYTLYGSGLIFGVTIPPMEAADRSRFIPFALTLDRGTEGQLDQAKAWIAAHADGLRQRFLALWPVFKQALPIFVAALDADRGFQGRDAKVFGSVLAARWLLEHDRPPAVAEASQWVARIESQLLVHQHDSEVSDVDKCLTRLLTSTVRAFRGGDELTVGEVCEDGIAAVTERNKRGEIVRIKEILIDRAPASLALRRYGLRLVIEAGRLCLAVAHDHDQLRRIFGGTRWSDGGWRESLMNFSSARPSAAPLRFKGGQSRATVIDVAVLPFELQGDSTSRGDDPPDI